MHAHREDMGTGGLAHEDGSKLQRAGRGFTLIELLVVIAIIAILASLLVPAVQRALDRARLAACASNMHQLGVGWANYASDHEGTMPFLGQQHGKFISQLSVLG